MKIFLICFCLLLIGCVPRVPVDRITLPEYKKINFEDKKLAIVPSAHISVVSDSFKIKYPDITDPVQVFNRAIENDFHRQIRHLSNLNIVFTGRYITKPSLEDINLNISEKKSFVFALPEEGTTVDMMAKTKNINADILLFFHIDTLDYNDKAIKIDVKVENLPITVSKYYPGIIFKNTKYVFWDNEKGKIISYGKISPKAGVDENFNSDYLMQEDNNILKSLAGSILYRTPFSKKY